MYDTAFGPGLLGFFHWFRIMFSTNRATRFDCLTDLSHPRNSAVRYEDGIPWLFLAVYRSFSSSYLILVEGSAGGGFGCVPCRRLSPVTTYF